MNIITVDIGNSATKISLDSQSPLVRVDLSDLSELSDLESLAVAAGFHHWVIVSVAPQKTKTLAAWLAKNRPDDKATVITNDDIPTKSSVKNRAGVGTDRLLAAYAATQLNQDKASVIVDAGTAVTIDYVNDQGTFCGGMIFPGIASNLKSLAVNTAMLPDLADSTIEPVTHDIRVGDDTQSAILHGVAQSQAWAIVSITEKLAKQHDAQVFVTGGDARVLKNLMPVSWKNAPNLIHDGCRKLFPT